MTDRDDRRGRPRAGAASEGSRDLLVSSLLVGATAAILGAGALLRSGPEREHPAPAQALASPAAIRIEAPPVAPPPGTAAPAPPAATPSPARSSSPARAASPRPAAPAPVPAPVPASTVRSLARRTATDVARIGRARGRWTAQVLVACHPENVTRLLGKVDAGAPLYLLPVEVNGEACFRVCWGAYASRAEAARTRDLPVALRGGERVRPVEIVKVLP